MRVTMRKQVLLMIGCTLIGGMSELQATPGNDKADQRRLQEQGQKQGFKKPRFIDLDLNGDAFITLAEFKENPLPHGEHETIFSHIDADGNGEITPDEFESHRPPRHHVRAAKGERPGNG